MNNIFNDSNEKNEEVTNQIILPQLRTIRNSQSDKYLKNNNGKRILKQREPTYLHVKLKSGEKMIFTEDDGKNILLNAFAEPNRLVRNIISKIPRKITEKIEYLSKFEINHEEEEEEEEDEKEEKEEEEKFKNIYYSMLKKCVYSAYIKEWRLRFLFKRLLIHWRVYKMNKTAEAEIDPITLTYPEKQVIIYDWNNRKKFIFEAKTLSILIESKLAYQEYGFPKPLYPKNPKNNVEFTYKQLITIFYQLSQFGELRWGLSTLREYNFSKVRWHLYHKSTLTMNAIKYNITYLDTLEARDLFSDFIFSKMEDLGITQTEYITNAYNKAILLIPNHWFLDKFKPLAILHYEAEHFNQNISSHINVRCTRLFRKHGHFFKDLINKCII
jgi:hypothetical protein